jgi:multidrug resistance efflux pump
MPTGENDAQFQRAQISLLDEKFAQFMFQQNLNYLNTVFANELLAIDLDIKRLQVAYLSTLLISPINGVVTGLFRDPGDCVKAGQPVLRVENDEEVYLVGTLIYRGLIQIGTSVTVTTKIFDSPAALPPLTGSVVSVRGHDAKDDEWDILVRCGNRSGGKPILPMNYNFDYDDTTIDVS